MITRALPADLDLLGLHRLDPARYPVLFESSASGAHGRWGMLLAHAGDRLELQRDGLVRSHDGLVHPGTFLDVLDAHWRALRCAREVDAAWPFRGGWALFLGYKLAAQVE